MPDKKGDVERIVDALALISTALIENTEQARTQFEWLKSNSGLATKTDLQLMQATLLDAISKISPGTPLVDLGLKLGPVVLKPHTVIMDITLTNEQQVHATLNPVTPKGKPAQLDGKPVWSVSSGDATVQNVSDDGLQADLVSGDSPGDSEILIEADADLGSGVVTISDVVKVTVIGAMATSLGLTLGTPTDKP